MELNVPKELFSAGQNISSTQILLWFGNNGGRSVNAATASVLLEVDNICFKVWLASARGKLIAAVSCPVLLPTFLTGSN